MAKKRQEVSIVKKAILIMPAEKLKSLLEGQIEIGKNLLQIPVQQTYIKILDFYASRDKNQDRNNVSLSASGRFIPHGYATMCSCLTRSMPQNFCAL